MRLKKRNEKKLIFEDICSEVVKIYHCAVLCHLFTAFTNLTKHTIIIFSKRFSLNLSIYLYIYIYFSNGQSIFPKRFNLSSLFFCCIKLGTFLRILSHLLVNFFLSIAIFYSIIKWKINIFSLQDIAIKLIFKLLTHAVFIPYEKIFM